MLKIKDEDDNEIFYEKLYLKLTTEEDFTDLKAWLEMWLGKADACIDRMEYKTLRPRKFEFISHEIKGCGMTRAVYKGENSAATIEIFCKPGLEREDCEKTVKDLISNIKESGMFVRNDKEENGRERFFTEEDGIEKQIYLWPDGIFYDRDRSQLSGKEKVTLLIRKFAAVIILIIAYIIFTIWKALS